MQIDGSKMQLSLALAQEAKDLAQTATSVPAPMLGEMPKRRDARSGRAILALQSQSDASTSHYIQNLASISLPYDARVFLDLAPAIYDRPGRVEQIVGTDDKTETVILNAPFVQGQDGQPMAVPPGVQPPPEAKFYNLDDGKYGIETSIGKSYQTQMQEGVEVLGEIFSSAPELFPILGDLWVEMKQMPKGDEMAQRIKDWRAATMPQLAQGKDGAKLTPEQAQQKAQALEQQVQQLTQQLQQAMQAMQMKQAEQQATLQKTQLDNESRERITEANNQTKILIAKIDSLAATLESSRKIAHEKDRHHEEMAHDVAMAHAGGRTVTVSRDDGSEDEGSQEDSMEDGRSQSSGPEGME